jgi:hypothetical protein
MRTFVVISMLLLLMFTTSPVFSVPIPSVEPCLDCQTNGAYPEIIFQETPDSPKNPNAFVVSVSVNKGAGVDTCQWTMSDGVKQWIWVMPSYPAQLKMQQDKKSEMREVSVQQFASYQK